MKTKLLLASLLILGSMVAQEMAVSEEQNVNQQFGYVSLGVGPLPVPLPAFSVGYRSQKNHHGMDVGLQTTTMLDVTQMKANLLYEYYFKPSKVSQFYMGGGIGPSVVFGSGDTAAMISPEFVFGKQYRNESRDLRFFQAQISFPTLLMIKQPSWLRSNPDVLTFPLVLLTYGLGF
jgi:hypothetical protein